MWTVVWFAIVSQFWRFKSSVLIFFSWWRSHEVTRRRNQFQQRFKVNVWDGIVDACIKKQNSDGESSRWNPIQWFPLKNTSLSQQDVPLNVREDTWFYCPFSFHIKCVIGWFQTRGSAVGSDRLAARASHMNPFDLFLSGCVKRKRLCHATEAQGRDDLINRILVAGADMVHGRDTIRRRCETSVRVGEGNFKQ
jgi:hypothetical protein